MVSVSISELSQILVYLLRCYNQSFDNWEQYVPKAKLCDRLFGETIAKQSQ